ncbi:MAG: HD domain-containing phosphohydrolase [Planctomycetota bacterium]
MIGTILLVDKDATARQQLSPHLRNAGFEVRCASNGMEALRQMADGEVRLVISDWKMPELNGIDLCRRIRAGDFGGYVYFVLLTDCDSVSERVEGLTSGADDFVSKPVHPSELLARIQVGRRVLQLETREALIFSLAKLAESRDPETGHHIERVQWYSKCLAEQLAHHPKHADVITPRFVQLIFQTSPLHDIGKVGVPDHVLLKPGKLTSEEFEEIKKHPLLGADTLKGAIERSPDAAFLRMAHDIALSHHEKYDGSGYPHGIAGEEIPVCARIVALADVYDALTTNRVYKAAFTHAKARSIILDGHGSHFDPDVVDAFLVIEDLFQAIRERYQSDEERAPVAAPVSTIPISTCWVPT